MFGVFDEFFDLNNDGSLDPSEQAIELMVLDDLMNDEDESEEDEY